MPITASSSPCPAAPEGISDCLVAISFVSSGLGFGLYAAQSAPTPTAPLLLVETSDGGRVWEAIGPTTLDNGVYRPGLLFLDASHGFVWSGGALSRTHDGGRSWASVALPGRVLDVTHAGPILWALTSTCSPYTYRRVGVVQWSRHHGTSV